MSYTPHASEITQPLDTVDRSTAAAEFRELKTHINGMSTVASATTPDIFNNTNKIISYTGAVLATGFVAAPAAGAERLLYCTGASSFTAGANLIIDGTASGNTLVVAAGYVVQVIALTATQFKLILISPAVVAHATSADTATNATNATNATTATTATNQSGGTVNATTINASGLITANAGVSGTTLKASGTVSGATATGTGTAAAVVGVASSSGNGVYGSSANGIGVYGISTSGQGIYGYSSSGYAMNGSSASGIGVYAHSTSGPALALTPQSAAPTTNLVDGTISIGATTGTLNIYLGGAWYHINISTAGWIA